MYSENLDTVPVRFRVSLTAAVDEAAALAAPTTVFHEKVGEAALRTLNASTMQRLAAMKETAENAKAELASAESKHAETLAAEIEKTVQKMEAEKNAAVSQERATVFQNVQQAIAALQTQ